MTPERMQQIEAVFHGACEHAPEEQPAFLNEACGADDALRREVEALLATDGQAASLFETPAYQLVAPLIVESDAQALLGKSISHYQIVSLLGKGGMGEVYQARDIKLDRTVAVKILPVEVSADGERLRRFNREAKAASALNHPNVAHIYEIGKENSVSFIAMEYVEGQTLAAKINGQPLAVGEIVEIGSQIAEAMDEAHGKGITHRDIKPANVMLTPRGQVKVLDFGLAKIARPAQPITSDISTLAKTAPGVVLGTVPYMSPEQALGREVDQRSDLFSLGVVLYEMATGRLPFAGSSPSEMLDRILHAQPEALARFNYDVPAELERIVRKCLEKERERRYQSARELLVDLKNLRRESEPKAMSAVPLVIAPKHRVNHLGFIAISVFLLLLVGAGCFWLFLHRPAIESVAILPFVNVGANPDAEYLSDGIAESLINSLSQLPQLKVMSRDSAFRYKRRDVSAQAAGQELNVQAVLTGRVTQRGDDLAISVELVDVRDNRHLWGEQYQQKLANLLPMQEEIVRKISTQLQLKLSGEEQQRLTKRYTDNSEAYRLFQQGQYYWNKRSEEGLKKAIDYFQQAIAKDANYAPAYAVMADCYRILDESFPNANYLSLAMESVNKALAIDDSLADAHAILGSTKMFHAWDWTGAGREFKRALQLNPNSVTTRQRYSVYLMFQGRAEESLTEINKALELDPVSPVINGSLTGRFYYARRYDEAIAQAQKTLDLEPNYAYAWRMLGRAYEAKKRYEEAIAALLETRRLNASPETLGALGHAFAVAGRTVEAEAIVAELKETAKARPTVAYDIAVIYVGLGEKEQAFAWLEKAYVERSGLGFLGVNPIFDSLRIDPRFTALLRRIGLKP